MANLEAKVITFHTASGGVYEILGNKLRQVQAGEHYTLGGNGRAPLGEWKEFYEITIPAPGQAVIIYWNDKGSVTATTRVTRVDTQSIEKVD